MQIAMTTAAMITDAGGQTVKGTPPDGGGEGRGGARYSKVVAQLMINARSTCGRVVNRR